GFRFDKAAARTLVSNLVNARAKDILDTKPDEATSGLTDTADKLIVTAGMAEIAAGSIAMGLGGYLAARNDAEHYAAEQRREHEEVVEKPHLEREEVAAVFRRYGLTPEQIAPILSSFERNADHWVDFMMRFELGLERPEPGRSLHAALTIGGAYIIGGLVPMAPYFFLNDGRAALCWSATVTLLALLAFGYVKGRVTSGKPWRSALHTTLVGGVAAAAAFGIARLFT
ncbi:MAG: VIT1/CCC1 transporter family protein, partial [Elusimicrobia bacterium]|nr:VIT1/CCC1 transporter family protein [Elusimicrobiota bacterium]